MRRQRNNQRLVPRRGDPRIAPARRIEPSASPGARYTRAWRRRERSGQCLLRLEVDEASVIVGLVDRGLLSPLRADDRIALAEAAAKALMQFCGEVATTT
jgi:hypothetical protein